MLFSIVQVLTLACLAVAVPVPAAEAVNVQALSVEMQPNAVTKRYEHPEAVSPESLKAEFQPIGCLRRRDDGLDDPNCGEHV